MRSIQNPKSISSESSTIGISERQLRAFTTVATTLSYAQAAELLHYTHSGVYLQVKGLERLLGCRLLERSGRGIRLTPAGRTLLPICRSALTEIDRMEHVSQRLASARRVRVAAGLVSGCYLLPPLIQEFSREEPDILIDVHSGPSEEVLSLVAAGTADLGIAGGLDKPPLPAHLSLMRLFDEPYCLLVSASLAQTPEPPVVIYRIHPDLELPPAHLRQIEALGIYEYELRFLPSAEAVKGACAAGQGYGMLLRGAASLELRAGILREVDGFAATATVWSCQPNDGSLSPEARAFVDFLREHTAQAGRSKIYPRVAAAANMRR